MVNDLHHKLAKWLCTNYRVIILPEFKASEMIKKGNRKIDNKTVRKMSTLSHYRFRQHLLNKVREYPGVKIMLASEEYTSKTCGRCGQQNEKLGKSKIFSCKKCAIKMDRDHNGARNILIKTLTEAKKALRG
jgi:putative transposase